MIPGLRAALLLALPLALSLPQGRSPSTPVFVSASITDSNGLFVENLERNEVVLLEDGMPREIEFLAQEEVPAAYGILFELELLKEEAVARRAGNRPILLSNLARDVAYQIIDKRLAGSSIWVGGYDREMKIVQEASPNAFLTRAAVHQLQGSRETREPFFYGALYAGLRKLSQAHEKRRALLVFMNLIDTKSAEKMRALTNLLKVSNVEVFTISFAGRLGAGPGLLPPAMSDPMLKDLAGQSAGGAFLRTDFGEHTEDLVRRLSNQIRTLYTFGFTSRSTPEKPAELRITCKRPGSKVKHRPLVPVLN